jgi:polysaccharide biosynthesis/export protein
MKPGVTVAAILLALSTAVPAWAQSKPATPAAPTASQQASEVTPPPDYVIGAGDVLTVTYWRDKDMTGDYVVRPDGKITLPLINDVEAVGLTPDQLKERLLKASAKLFVDPSITVGLKEINSRKVYINGGVVKPGAYDLLSSMTVAQLISVAGSLREFVDGKNIRVLRIEGGKQFVFKFNYKEVLDGKNLGQNIQLKPGDTVLVPE